MSPLSEILSQAPHQPGVYLMKDAKGRVFYIGKAKDLLNRMRQYINPSGDTRPFVQILGRLLSSVEFILTSSEKEALILENTLVKRHYPAYNVKIKDDKNYFSLRLDLKQDYPRLEIIRQRKDDGALYFGPYHSAQRARRMFALVNRHFRLCECNERAFKAAKRPCLRYQMGRCLGPCSMGVTREQYHAEVRRVRLFLEGRGGPLVEELTRMMQAASGEEDFERAAMLRDQIEAVNVSLEPQFMDLSRDLDWDALGLHREGEAATAALMEVRDGRIVNRRTLDLACRALPDGALLSNLLSQYYETISVPPERILLPFAPEEDEALGVWLSERRGRRVELSVPERGTPARLVALANDNARQVFQARRSREARAKNSLERLQSALGLPAPPQRIECVDISNIQGSFAVGSLVCFIGGEPAGKEYRRYKIQLQSGPDDFAMMHEVLTRRVRRGLEEGTLPDLLVVDGGKGQLAVARAVLRELGAAVSLAALAKSKLKEEVGEGEIAESFEGKKRIPERVFLPHQKNPVLLKPGTAELSLLQRLRDEAHRFAITYHRKLRGQANRRSGLQDIPGVGPKRARELLTHFGSLKRVREATPEQVAALPGFNAALALRILSFLKGKNHRGG